MKKRRETLLNRLSRLEISLSKEKGRTTKFMNNIGWGTGMRYTKCTPSFRRENEIMEKIQIVQNLLKELEQ